MTKTYPAIALIETDSVADGIRSADMMVKKAPITVIRSGTVHNGKFLILIGGSVAAVEEAFIEGVHGAGNCLIDQVFLPQVDRQVHDALLGKKLPFTESGVAIIETTSVAATVRSADAAVKGTTVNLIELRMADDLGGRAFAIFNGFLEDVESAVNIARSNTTDHKFWWRDTIIPRIDHQLATQVTRSSQFGLNEMFILNESEL